MPESSNSPLAAADAFLDAFEMMVMQIGIALVAEGRGYTSVSLGTASGDGGMLELLGPFSAPIDYDEFVNLRTGKAGSVDVRNGLIAVRRDYFASPTTEGIHADG